MQSVETSAKTRKEAIQKALDALGVELHEVEIEILDEGSRGIFGFGARDVRVRVKAESLPDRPAARPQPARDQESGSRRQEPSRRPPRDRGPQDRPQRDRPPRDRAPQDRPPRDRAQQDRPPRDRTPQDRPPRDKAQQQDRPPRDRAPRDRAQQDRPPRNRAPQDRPPRDRAQQERRPDAQPRPPRPPRPPREPRPERQERSERAPERPPEPVTEELINEAVSLMDQMIKLMGIEATVKAGPLDEGSISLLIESPDSALLIGRKGRNLSAMQYLVDRMCHEDEAPRGAKSRVIVDIEGYQDRRRQSLEEMALSLAERAKETHREMRVKPLNPQERRIIHMTLQDDPDIRTFSLGNSLMRTVVISPKDLKAGEGERPPRRSRGGDEGGGGGGGRRGRRGGDRNRRPPVGEVRPDGEGSDEPRDDMDERGHENDELRDSVDERAPEDDAARDSMDERGADNDESRDSVDDHGPEDDELAEDFDASNDEDGDDEVDDDNFGNA